MVGTINLYFKYKHHGEKKMFGKRLALGMATAVALMTMHGAVLAGKADDTLVWATSTEIDTPDIYYGNQREALIATYAMCDSLVQRDPITNEYQPLLALSWKWTDDRTLDVKLRKGVKFHNGKDFGAEDVAYTFNHLAPESSGMVFRALVDWIKNVEVVAPDEVIFHATRPAPAALEYLTGTSPIFPKGHYDNAPTVPTADGKTRRDYGAVLPMCTGPYKLSDYKPGQSLTLVKNDNYFEGSPKGKPHIGKIIFRTIPDVDTQVSELMTGGVDWIWGVPPENAKLLAEQPNLTVKSAATMRMSFLSLDAAGRSGDNPMKDVRVRRAMFYAIDRAALVKNLVGDGAVVQKSMCSMNQFGCTDKVPDYPYDPAKAKALLAEAGYPNGFDITFYAYRDRPFSEAVANYLRAVGIRTNMQFMQWRALRPIVTGGKAQLVHLTLGSNGMLDASASTSYYFKFTPDDYARDPQVRDWLETADTSIDPETRKTFYAKALARINDQAYFVPLFTYGRTYAFNKDLDYPLTPDEMAHFYLARWK